MANVVVVGSQWGDEGKGKIVDWLSEQADVVVRFQGGHNAGHTLVIDGNTYKLSLLPSGVVRGKLSVIGNGVVVDPWALLAEIERIGAQGVEITPDLLVLADNAALILPLHRDLDSAREAQAGDQKIGTTGRGIGPAYEDKVARRAIRIADMLNETRFAEKLRENLDYHNFVLTNYLGGEAIEFQKTFDDAMALVPRLKPMVGDVSSALYAAHKAGGSLLFEGAQGSLLDVDHGTYPFVTSSNCVAGNAAAGAGVGPNMLHYIMGITKAYTTRVGSGPFPSELPTDAGVGEHLSRVGHEFGTVTGRARRCGWFDAVLVRQSIAVNGIDGVALTKLDVLDGLESLSICTGYRIGERVLDYLPAGMSDQAAVQPIYEVMEGWSQSTAGARSWVDLPANAVKYVKRLEELIGAPVALLSTSPERDDTILMRDPFAG